MRGELSAALLLVAVGACQPSVPSPPPTPARVQPSVSAVASVPVATGPAGLFATTYAPEAGTAGGQLVVGDWQEAQSFNPFYVSQVTEANVASATWATLVVLTHDFKYAPDLAVDIPTVGNGGVAAPGVGGDAMTVTWTLKPDLKWSDGEPLTCDDFEYAWEWVLDPANAGVITAGWRDITDWECASATEMVLHFGSVHEGYISLVVAPLPRHYLEMFPIGDQVNGAGFRPEEMPGVPTSGAFSFRSVTPGQELRLERNEHYRTFRRDAPAYLDEVVFKWYGDPEAMIGGYRGGEIDLAVELQDSDLPKVRDLGDEVSAIPALSYEFLRPNWAAGTAVRADGVGGCSRNPAVTIRGDGCPMADPAMRRALAHAIDKEAIRSRLLGGTVDVATSAITPEVWYYQEQPTAVYDPERARSILEDAGWVDRDGDEVREKDGLRALVELCTNSRQVRVDTLALVSGWLSEIGVESVVTPVDNSLIFADYNESTPDTPCSLSRGNFDLAHHAFLSSIDPLSNYFSYHSSQFPPAGGNDAHVDDAEVDAALDVVRRSVDFDTIRGAMADFQRRYVEGIVEIPLYYRRTVELVDPALGNFAANPTQAGPTWNAGDWYLIR
jgi:peptide/nickel transport system substrate-binding protein